MVYHNKYKCINCGVIIYENNGYYYSQLNLTHRGKNYFIETKNVEVAVLSCKEQIIKDLIT